MNDKEKTILEMFRYALNPSLLVEEVVNSSIGIIQLLPSAGSRIEYKHDYKHPEYYKDSAAFGQEEAPVKEIITKGSQDGITVMVSFVDRAFYSMGADFTGGGGGPNWLWVKKSDDSPINVDVEAEGKPNQDYKDIGYTEFGYKPVTFIINWLNNILSPYGGKMTKSKISHPPFKSGKYPKGYDIKEVVYFDIPRGFKSENQKKAFDELLNKSDKLAWFNIVGYPEWSSDDSEAKAAENVGDYGRWFIIGKTSEPGFEMDASAKAEIDSERAGDVKEKKYKFLDRQFTKYSHRDPFDRFNTKAAKEKWDKSIALISNILSRSGKVTDDRKLTSYYLSMALEKLLKEYDPVDFQSFNPENMEEYQANELFGFQRKGIKGIIKDIIMKIDENPEFLKLENTVKEINSLLENVDFDNEEEQMDMALFMHATNSDGFTRNDLHKMFPDRTKALQSLDRLEKKGQIMNKSGKYVANPSSEINKSMNQMKDNKNISQAKNNDKNIKNRSIRDNSKDANI